MSFFKRKNSFEYFLVDAAFRAVRYQENKGGAFITIRFKKTSTFLGRTTITEETVEFNNFHTREKDAYGNRLFTYNPPYVSSGNAEHWEDSIWHSIGVWNNCESYPFAPITTRQLNLWLDAWEKTLTNTSCPYCGHFHTIKKTIPVIDCDRCSKKFAIQH